MNTFWDWVVHLSANLNSGILSLVESIWLYPSVFAVALFDAIIPIFPSESVVIGSASAWQSVGHPNLVFLFIVAAAGAWCGDQTAYLIGTRLDVRSIKFFRRPKVLAALDWAERSLEHRGALYIIAARFIPMGRVAVNLTAGALRYPHRRFMAVDAVATSIWAAWGILIGTVAASLLGNNLLLSIAVGVTGGVLLGLAVEKVMALFGLTAPEMPDLAGEIEHREEPASE
ncbi:DedA family protein [Demequina lutea]|uniref:Membrane protein DedA with SNARE-associated domain n=1 Tax=Demequina lutea TaxID=431489 RepID=A0A7Y9Z896_9MICO|nr:VTT domain-containing protein [Demequina lutea]NYI40659.1 membrane protein DedA with SNARE-associated domain [Demequina lutea]